MTITPWAESGRLQDCTGLLSHRGRGFGYGEATPQAVRAALQSGIRYLEIDTRVAADGVIYTHHGARIRTRFMRPQLRTASETTLAMHGVVRLADLLRVVVETIDASQMLCIDIKDFGFEREHVELVERFGLADQTVFISWIPHVLAALHTIAPRYPLIFSHINLHALPFGAEWVEAVLADRELRMLDYIVLGPGSICRPLRHTIGFQHALIARDLPESFIRLLADCGGGICVRTYCVCDELDAWCARHSLQQWVFTANDAGTYRKLRQRPAIQVIFSDDPLRVARAG